MSDPRAFLVKSCPPAYLDKGLAFNANTSEMRREFFNSIGKIGDLEVLNHVGANKIGEGLRTVASISNSVRTGCGSVPSIIGETVDAGANWILDSIGIGPTVVNTLREFHPEMANLAFGQARQLFEQVNSGHFKTTDIPYYLQDFQNLEMLTRSIYTPGNGDYSSFVSEACEASPYAMDLLARAPKQKFLFIVQFIMNEGYSNVPTDLDFAFVVKTSTRPNIKFNAEDVNYYGYRSKVITKTEFDDMTMSFYDDDLNTSMKFFSTYLKVHSPIANYQTPDELMADAFGGGLNNLGESTTIDEVQISNVHRYPSSSGPLTNSSLETMIKEIRLFHLFDYGKMMNVYKFLNPRIINLSLDDLDMSVSEETLVKIQFAYDSVYLATDVNFKYSELGQSAHATQRNAYYPLRYVDNSNATTGPNNYAVSPVLPVNGSFTGCQI